MDFLSKEISEYAERFTTPEGSLLEKITRETHLHEIMPRMLSGHLQGRFLSFISQMIKPKRVLEIGTYTGYSSICIAEGLAPDGLIYTIDINEELEPRVLSYFHEAGLQDQAKMLIGNAIDLVPDIDERYDLVFIDADKENYPNYFDLVIDRMAPGGWIVADNVLWSGKVLGTEEGDKDTQALRAYNEKIHQDSRVDNILLPIRDGLMVCRKKS